MDEASTEPLAADGLTIKSKDAIAGYSLAIDPEMVEVSKPPFAEEGHAIDSEMVEVSKQPLAGEGLNMESNVAPYWCTSPGGSIARFNREEDAIKFLKQMTGADEDLLGMGDVGPDIMETENLLANNGIDLDNLGNLYGFPEDKFPEEASQNGGFFSSNEPIPTVDKLVTQRSPLTSKTLSSPSPTPSESVPVETANSSKKSQPQEPSLAGKIKPPKSKNKPYDTETAKQKKKKPKKKKQQNKKDVPDGQNKPRGPKKNNGGRPTLKETTERMEIELAAKKAVIQALKDATEPIPVGENKKASSNEEEALNDDNDTNDQEDLNKDVIKEKPIEALNDKGESEDNDVQIVFEEDSSQQLLIICKAFSYENLDDMEVHFGLRFGIDKVGRSAIKTLFIVKSVEKDFAEEALEKINSRNYKDKPMKSMVYKNSKNTMYKLPKICIFTERKKNKQNK